MSTIEELVNKFNPNIKLMDVSSTINTANFKKKLATIKKNQNVLLLVNKNSKNAGLFGNGKDIGLFYLNRYMFFDKGVPMSEISGTLQKMINGENATNKCIVCGVADKETKMACVGCGDLMCSKCWMNSMKSMAVGQMTIELGCPTCKTNGMKIQGVAL